MNTYSKYCPNVYLAKTEDTFQKGDTIFVQTKYGKENECIVFNLIFQRDGFNYYSIVRSDGFNAQEYAKRRAERLQSVAHNAEVKSDLFRERSNQHADFLRLAEPIKVGHHSEKRHRKIIEDARRNFGKSYELGKRAEEYQARSEYWEKRASIINLSMPESLDFFEFKLEEARIVHHEIKTGIRPKLHSYSLAYANKDVKDLEKKVELATLLWA